MILLIVFSLVILIIIALANLRRKEMGKGELGELQVNNILDSIRGYILFKDVLLKTDKGTTQIDHILVGKKGIFVIETKNYSGTIYGSEWDKDWTQVLFTKKIKFYNPIRQNYGHIKAVEKKLSLISKNDIYPIIVFSNDCSLKHVNTDIPVIPMKKVKRYIKRFKSNTSLDKEQIEYICKNLDKSNIQKKRTRKNHIKKVNKLMIMN